MTYAVNSSKKERRVILLQIAFERGLAEFLTTSSGVSLHIGLEKDTF